MFWKSDHICDFSFSVFPVEFKKAGNKDVWSIASHLSGSLTTVGKFLLSKSWKKVELRLNLSNNWSQLFNNQTIFYTLHMDGLIYMCTKHISVSLIFSIDTKHNKHHLHFSDVPIQWKSIILLM